MELLIIIVIIVAGFLELIIKILIKVIVIIIKIIIVIIEIIHYIWNNCINIARMENWNSFNRAMIFSFQFVVFLIQEFRNCIWMIFYSWLKNFRRTEKNTVIYMISWRWIRIWRLLKRAAFHVRLANIISFNVLICFMEEFIRRWCKKY